MANYYEPAKAIPIREECDVLVVGGGTAGVVAALASARNGAKTILVEQYGFLGGTIHAGVCGVHSFFNNYQMFGREKKQLVQGIPGEIAEKMMQRGASPGHISQSKGFDHFDVVTTFAREEYKQLAFELMAEAGVKLLLHTFFSDVIIENGEIKGILIESKNGREAIFAKCVVDTTGDGDVALRAGCETVPELEEYPVGMLFAMANVDVPRLAAFLEKNNCLEHLAEGMRCDGSYGPIRLASHFFRNPELKQWANDLGIWGVFCFSCHDGELTYINGSNARGLQDMSPEEWTRAEVETRRAVTNMAQALKTSFPGFEKAYISWTAPTVGVRRSRVIRCEHDLSDEEIESGARFDDEIGLFGFHDLAPVRNIAEGGWYGFPYCALLPIGVEGLLVAGRMVTSSKSAHMSTRNSACCMLQGQAAGTAAAMAAKLSITPRMLDAQLLRKQLRRDGVCLE